MTWKLEGKGKDMYELLIELLLGIVRGVVYGGIAAFPIIFLSLIFRYFTNEKLPSFIGIILGLGILGVTGGLLAVLEQTTVEGVAQIVIGSIVIVWGVGAGDKMAEKIPKVREPFSLAMKDKKPKHITIKLPSKHLIYDISGKPKVLDELKSELSEREFIFPYDLSIEEISSRIKRRLSSEWGVGDVELEIDDTGKIVYLAVSAKKSGLSETIPKGKLAVPVKCNSIPSGLSSNDIVRIYLKGKEIIDQVEVRDVNKEDKIVTVIVDSSSFEKIMEKEAQLIVALPSTKRKIVPVTVKKRSGTIEEFDNKKIFNSIIKAGAHEDLAEEIAEKVKMKVAKLTTPIETEKVREFVIGELEKADPQIAKKFKKYQKTRFQ